MKIVMLIQRENSNWFLSYKMRLFGMIFKQLCSSEEIITLFLLRNSFSIIWNITNYGCQAEARGNELWAWLLRSSCEEGEVNGDFLSSAAQRYIHSIWLESREENMGRHCWTNSLSNIMSSFSWMCPLCYHPIY